MRCGVPAAIAMSICTQKIGWLLWNRSHSRTQVVLAFMVFSARVGVNLKWVINPAYGMAGTT